MTPAPVIDLLSARLRAAGLPAVARPGRGHRRLRRPHPPARRLAQVLDRDGAVLLERAGTVLAPCGNRRAAVCPACSDRYAADAYHLLRAGLAGDDTKNVPDTVAEHPRVFLTLTAPSFGPVHTRTVTRRGHVIPCRCGDRHHPDDPRLGTAVDPDTYDYQGAVLWQAHAGLLWARFTTTLRRALAAAPRRPRAASSATTPGCPTPRSPSTNAAGSCTSTPSSASTAPTDPPTRHRPGSTCPRFASGDHRRRPRRPASPSTGPDGTPLVLGWGAQLDLRAVTPTARRQIEDRDGEITDAALAGYIAKYATKTTGATDGADRPIRDGAHIAHLDIPDHHRRMIDTAWQLGDLPDYDGLNLRRWAHMLGFRGHFLTKSHALLDHLHRPARGNAAPGGCVDDLDPARRDTDDPQRHRRPTSTPSP